MKPSLKFFTLIFCALIWSCEGIPEPSPDPEPEPVIPIIIKGVYPNSNPIGGPVLIKGQDFTDDTKIYFGGKLATIEERTDTFLTTKVPESLGSTFQGSLNIELVGDNTYGVTDFTIISNQDLKNFPTSPPSIFIPTRSFRPPLDITSLEFVSVFVKNVYAENGQRIQLIYRLNGPDPNVDFDKLPDERLTIKGVYFDSRVTFDGEVLWPYDSENPSVSKMEIHRSTTESSPSEVPHPYDDDILSGEFTYIENFQFPSTWIDDPITPTSDNFLLLTSEITGRQYLFVVLCYSSCN